MKSSQIEIEVINSARDYQRVLFWFHFKKIIIVGILYLTVIIPFIWLTLFGAGASPLEENNKPIILVTVFFALLPILISGTIFFNIRRQAKNIEKTLEPTKFIFSDKGLESFSKSASVSVTWDSIQKVQELKEDFLFYPQKNIFYTIPKRFFQNNLQIEEFRELVRTNLGEKAKLNITL